MAFTVTPARRRLAMIALLVLASAGAVIRTVAPDPSTLRDIGTLLLVLWLPAIGNLIAYLSRKIPRSAPPPTDFPPGSAFTPQLRVRLERVEQPATTLAMLSPGERRCTLIVGRRGFTVRLGEPVAQALATAAPQDQALEFLQPPAALPHLAPGSQFHLLVGRQAVAKGSVTEHVAPAAR